MQQLRMQSVSFRPVDNQNLLVKCVFIAFFSVVLFGCVAGGDLIKHEKPRFFAGKKTTVKIELSVNAGNADKGFEFVKLHYKFSNRDEFCELVMSRKYSSRERVCFDAVIYIGADLAGKKVQYFFEYFGDGITQYYPDKENGFIVPVESESIGGKTEIENSD